LSVSGEALGAIGCSSVIDLLTEYSKDAVPEVQTRFIVLWRVIVFRKYLHISFWRAFSLYLTSAADLNSLVLLPGGLLWMPY